jgi:hypothetical protein
MIVFFMILFLMILCLSSNSKSAFLASLPGGTMTGRADLFAPSFTGGAGGRELP